MHMAKVFLSHNTTQKELVEQIANEIGSDFVYFDKFNFSEGNLLEDEIDRELERYSICDCSIIELDRHHSDRKGDICVVENGETLPFDVKRVYYLYDVPGGAWWTCA